MCLSVARSLRILCQRNIWPLLAVNIETSKNTKADQYSLQTMSVLSHSIADMFYISFEIYAVVCEFYVSAFEILLKLGMYHFPHSNAAWARAGAGFGEILIYSTLQQSVTTHITKCRV